MTLSLAFLAPEIVKAAVEGACRAVLVSSVSSTCRWPGRISGGRSDSRRPHVRVTNPSQTPTPETEICHQRLWTARAANEARRRPKRHSRPTDAGASRGNVALFCGGGNHSGSRGLRGGGRSPAELVSAGQYPGNRESTGNFPRKRLPTSKSTAISLRNNNGLLSKFPARPNREYVPANREEKRANQGMMGRPMGICSEGRIGRFAVGFSLPERHLCEPDAFARAGALQSSSSPSASTKSKASKVIA
jgi:hypothetical protein